MAGGGRTPTWKERENNKRRERRRRAIAAKIFSGLRMYGNYKLPKHCDNNQVLQALCLEAGWTVEPDGTTYRKGCKPVESIDNIGRSISASPSSSYQLSPCTSFNPSPISSSFTSPASSSYTANVNNPDGCSLIPWLKQLSSGSSSASTSKVPHLIIHGGSISAPVTPPLSSPTAQTPRINPNWGPHYPFFPSSTPPSPGHHMVAGPDFLTGIRAPISPTFSLMSSHPFGFFRDEAMVGASSSRVLTPLQSGTCSPAIPAGADHSADVPMGKVISDEFAFGGSSKGLVKAWEGERIHEDCTSDDLELTLGCSKTR